MVHFGNCKSSQHYEMRCKSFNEPQASINAGAAGKGFLFVFYGERRTTVWTSRGIFTCKPLQNRRTFMLNSTWRLFHQRQHLDVNTRFECRHTTIGPSTAVVRFSVGPYRFGGRYGRPPLLQYLVSIYQSNMHIFSKSDNY